MTFVDLDRSFVRISKDKEPDFSIGSSWGRKLGSWLTWTELLDHRRVVLLAEASSGKTAEFRGRAEALRTEGRPGFFVAIEQLADVGLEAVLGPLEADLFQNWKASTQDAWFFLDSVDEARLNRKSFDLALKLFARELGVAALGRAHVFVSCRASDWKDPDDRRSVENLLPFPQGVTAPDTPESPEEALLGPIFVRKARPAWPASSEPQPPRPDELLVVQLVPLSEEQRRALATGLSVGDPGSFVAAINRQGLDAIAERPGDLLDLAEYWKSYGCIGSFEEMTEHGVTSKLRERDRFRADNEALAPDKAREGAERLAAALTLAKSSTLHAPGQEPDPTLAAGALEPADILDDWTDAQRNALARRGIFAPSTYGRIRFHHRSTQEYLTAMWFDRLLRAGAARAEVFALLFAERYGVETVVPSLRPAAAWLAIGHADICNEVVRREPLILLRHGAPDALPLEVRRRLLSTYSTKHAASEIADDSLDLRSLWMFADPALADAIRKAWSLSESADFRADLLVLIREGPILDCVDLARVVASNGEENDYHRIVALGAMAACDDRQGLGEAARSLSSDPAKASPVLAAGFAKILFPRHLTVDQLLEVIDLSQPPSSNLAQGFSYVIDDLWTACPAARARDTFLVGLADLCLQPPFVDAYNRLSDRHRQLAGSLEGIARSAVLKLGQTEPPEPILRLLMVVERAERTVRLDDRRKPPLADIVRASPKLHRALFWRDVEDVRRHREESQAPIHIRQVSLCGSPLWGPQEADLPWLYDDLKARSQENERRIALSAVLGVLARSARLEEKSDALRARVAGDDVLGRDLERYLAPSCAEDLSDLERQVRKNQERHERDAAEQERLAKASWVSLKADLLADPALLADAQEVATAPGVSRLWNLTRWLRARTGKEAAEAALQWRLLDEGFGRAVAEAYRTGLVALWRLVEPERPRREKGAAVRTKPTTILSSAGLAIEAAEIPAWASHLNASEAQRAARHGCMAEQGYPDWIEALASAQPDATFPVLRKTLEVEWMSKGDRPSYFLHRYANWAFCLSPEIEPIVYRVITGPEPHDLNALDRGLSILHRIELDSDRRRRLAGLARRRFRRCVATRQPERALRYVALLLLADAAAGASQLAAWLREAKAEEREALAEQAFSLLFGLRGSLVTEPLQRAPVRELEALVIFAYQLIRPEEDTVHEGSYTPDTRDDAESGRWTVVKALRDSPGPDGFAAMRRLGDHPAVAVHARRFRQMARGMAERDAEMPAWTISEVVAFEQRHLAPIKTGADLFRIVLGTLDDIVLDFENEDASSRRVVETAKDEQAVQNWLTEQLRHRSGGRFHAHREVEVAGGDLPDIVVASTAAPCEVAIEVKHGGKGWTIRKFEGALQKLARSYLKPAARRHGVLVITHHGDRSWRNPSTRKPMTFLDLIEHLSAVASSLTCNPTGPAAVAVRGIDASGSEEVVSGSDGMFLSAKFSRGR